MKIRLLGTGTPTPSLKQMCSGRVIEIGDDVLVFDRGFGAHHRLLELGLRPRAGCISSAATCITTTWAITRGCCSRAGIRARAGYRSSRSTVRRRSARSPLHCSSRAARSGPIWLRAPNICAASIYHARGGTGERKKPHPEVTELRSNDVTQGQSWTMKATDVAHFVPQLVSYGFRLDSGEGSFVYSDDSGPCASMVKLSRDCDVLAHMRHYISGTELCPEICRVLHGTS